MKILNAQNLAYFATSSSAPPTKEGWLSKRGEMNKSHQKRWFVLKGNMLFYSDKPSDKEPNGVIILEGYTVDLVDTAIESYSFQITFSGATDLRKYILRAENQASMESWMKAIAVSGYDYTRLMLIELREQLDELNAADFQADINARETKLPQAQEAFTVPAAKTPASNDSPQRTRKNPFDRNTAGIDLFGSAPFIPTPSTGAVPKSRSPKNSPKGNRLTVSGSPSKGSPRIGRKDKPVIPARTYEAVIKQTKFYTSTDSGSSTSLVTKSACKFSELHKVYGDQIRAFQAQLHLDGSSRNPGKSDAPVDLLGLHL